MSIAVPNFLDSSIQTDLNQSSTPSNTPESSEFSGVINDVSNHSGSNEFSNSSDRDRQASSESDRQSDRETVEASGNNVPEDGNQPPSEQRSSGGAANADDQTAVSNQAELSERDGGSETATQNEAALQNIEELLASEQDQIDVVGAGLQEQVEAAVVRADANSRTTIDANLTDIALTADQQNEILDSDIIGLETPSAAASAALNPNPLQAAIRQQGEANLAQTPNSRDLTSPTAVAADINASDEALGGRPADQVTDSEVFENSFRGSEVSFSRPLNAEGFRTTSAEQDAANYRSNAANVTQLAQNAEIDRNINAEQFLDDLGALNPRETSSLLSREIPANLLPTAPNTAQALGAANLTGLNTQSALSNLSGLSSPSTPFLSLNTAVDHAAWPEDFAVRVRTLVSGNVQQATLNLNPSELGSIEVNLVSEGNETRAQFAVQNASVRDAVESSLPRLKEIFEQSGLSLADADVRDQSQSSDGNNQNQNRFATESGDGLIEESTTESQVQQVSESLIRLDGSGLQTGVDTFI